MEKKEAVWILENGAWWDSLPDDMSDADKTPLLAAIDIAIAALKMPEKREPLTIEQLREVPHGKIKDSTLQSIYDRANKIAAAKSDLERAKIQAFVVTEYCPHCEKEQSILWDAGKDGYEIYCPTCGEKIMLCSVCDEFDTCDWREDSGCKKRKKG